MLLIRFILRVLGFAARHGSFVAFVGLILLLIYAPLGAIGVVDANLAFLKTIVTIMPDGVMRDLVGAIVKIVSKIAEFATSLGKNQYIRVDPQLQFLLRVVPEGILLWAELKILRAIMVTLDFCRARLRRPAAKSPPSNGSAKAAA